jgi:hypothetical protein
MVTLAILGALVVMISQVYSQTVRNREMVIGNLDTVNQAEDIMNLIVTDLEAMHTFDSRAYLFVNDLQLTVKDPADQSREVEVVCHAIAFPTTSRVRVTPDRIDAPGLMEVAYLIDDKNPNHEGHLRLFRRELAIETQAGAQEMRTSEYGLTLLASDLRGFSLEFLSAETVKEAKAGEEMKYETKWDPSWGPEKLPVAIRITLTVADPRTQGSDFTLKRIVRLYTNDVDAETMQPQLKKARGITDETTSAN